METEYLDIAKRDWKALLNAGIFHFRYCRVSLDYDDATEEFEEDLGNDEKQILGSLMRFEWLNRTLSTWDNIRQLYSDKDFSQANFLGTLAKNAKQAKDECRFMMDQYNRSENRQARNIFTQLAGRTNGN